jgi:hypothetical protein
MIQWLSVVLSSMQCRRSVRGAVNRQQNSDQGPRSRLATDADEMLVSVATTQYDALCFASLVSGKVLCDGRQLHCHEWSSGRLGEKRFELKTAEFC